MSSGIEYHERHTATADGRVPSRFGNPIDIPEDLLPIPEERPRAIAASHPLARYVTVRVEGEDGPRELRNCVGVDTESGITLEIDPTDEMDAFGCYPQRAKGHAWIQMDYDEAAISAENDRRLKRAMEMAALYAGVIDSHAARIEAEKAKKAAERAEQAAESAAPTTTEESQADGDHP